MPNVSLLETMIPTSIDLVVDVVVPVSVEAVALAPDVDVPSTVVC